jgi:hypothetical protein
VASPRYDDVKVQLGVLGQERAVMAREFLERAAAAE